MSAEPAGTPATPPKGRARPQAPALDLGALITDPGTRIVVCCGAGGVGKTTPSAALALAAAEAGQGVAIAWGVLVADALADGRLVRPFAAAMDDGTGYHIVMTEIASRRSTVQAFAGWLRRSLSVPEERIPEARGGAG